MQKLSCCLFIFFAIVVNAANDYFDLLQDEFEAKPTGQVRRFYITVEEGIWDYASEMDANANVPDTNLLGTRYYKALYHEYEDASYTKKKERFRWQGNMGPILRAEVGDIIQVFFWNRATRNYTMHPHGVFYETNQNYTYTWNVLPRTGPGPNDGDSIVWGYHSHVSENDIYAGLYGAIAVYKAGTLSNDQVVTSVFVGDENLSPYLAKTMSTLYPHVDTSKYTRAQLYSAHQFRCVNGLISLAPLGWGTYWDVRHIKWENSQVSWNGEVVDHIRLMPASFYTATIKPSKREGHFKFGSLDDEVNGMSMKYHVSL
ncbi:Cupredoxin [Mucor lusitanicus]